MSRATNDLNSGPHGPWPGHHVQRHHVVTMVLSISVMVLISPVLDSLGFVARSHCGSGRLVFRSSHPRALRKDSGIPRDAFRKSSGKSFRRPSHSRLCAGASGNRPGSTSQIGSTLPKRAADSDLEPVHAVTPGNDWHYLPDRAVARRVTAFSTVRLSLGALLRLTRIWAFWFGQ